MASGLEFFEAIPADIASGATFSTAVPVFGASVISVSIATAATSHALTIQASSTYTTTTFLPLVGTVYSASVGLATSTGGVFFDLGTGVAAKYIRIASDIALVDGQTISVNIAR